jgi:hypothetical protein
MPTQLHSPQQRSCRGLLGTPRGTQQQLFWHSRHSSSARMVTRAGSAAVVARLSVV